MARHHKETITGQHRSVHTDFSPSILIQKLFTLLSCQDLTVILGLQRIYILENPPLGMVRHEEISRVFDSPTRKTILTQSSFIFSFVVTQLNAWDPRVSGS